MTMHEPPAHFQVGPVDGLVVITMTDTEIKPEARDRLYEEADRLPEGSQVVLNLIHVQYFQSLVLGVLIHFQKRVRDRNSRVKLCCLHPHVERIFELTRTNELFEIYKDQESAIKAFQGKGSWLGKLFGG